MICFVFTFVLKYFFLTRMHSLKYCLIFILAIFSFQSLAQKKEKKVVTLSRINSIEEAEEYVKKNPKARVGRFNRTIDSIEYKEISKNYRVGDIFFGKKVTYKLLKQESEPIYSCQYIVFDGNQLPKQTIDSLRISLLNQAKNGVPFYSLIETMKRKVNAKGGDSGWFHKERLGTEFVGQLISHNVGDIFLLDDVANQKYYVVYKNANESFAQSWVFIAM